MRVPLLEGITLAAHHVRLDVNLHVVAHRVVDQQLTNQVIDAKVCPTGARHLAQVVAGPIALPQSTKHCAALSLAQRLAITCREQALALIASSVLAFSIPGQQRAYLLGQRQVMLDTGFRVLGRDEPFAFGQADVRPARHPGFTDPRAMAEHHQCEHRIQRRGAHDFGQLPEQAFQLNAAKTGRLDADLCLREVV